MSSKVISKGSKNILVGCGVLIALAAAFILLATLIPFMTGSGSSSFSNVGKDKIAVVELFGPIMGSEKIIKLIDKYAIDNSIKGILIRIDSPGGAVAPSQEIYHALNKARSRKPVVASFGSVAASGGYYVAMGADKIVTNEGTITGSIGVIMGFLDTMTLMNKIGVKSIAVKSGKYKDIGAGSRPFDEEDRKVMQAVINDVYDQFITTVATGRKMDKKKVRKLSDGRIYSGRMAVRLGLADQTGTYKDAIMVLAKLAGIKGEPAIIKEEEKVDFLKELLSEQVPFLKEVKQQIVLSPGLHFLWVGY